METTKTTSTVVSEGDARHSRHENQKEKFVLGKRGWHLEANQSVFRNHKYVNGWQPCVNICNLYGREI